MKWIERTAVGLAALFGLLALVLLLYGAAAAAEEPALEPVQTHFDRYVLTAVGCHYGTRPDGSQFDVACARFTGGTLFPDREHCRGFGESIADGLVRGFTQRLGEPFRIRIACVTLLELSEVLRREEVLAVQRRAEEEENPR